MAKDFPQNRSRNSERLWLLAITLVLTFLFYSLFTVLQRDFAEVPQRLSNGTMINLNDENPGQRLKNPVANQLLF